MHLSHTLQRWYAHNKRDLPWRMETDAYRIWLSEVILQQTRVNQGMPYYLRFVEQYPTVQHLAAAPADEVMKLWQGLGYYSRARNLMAAARQIVNSFGGRFPDNYNDIKSLKGVGSYTAAAIASLAFGLPHAVVDGNVYRVLARVYGVHIPVNSTEGMKHFARLAHEMLDRKNPGNHNQAIMEFGATCCKPAAPLCDCCPVHLHCEALKQGKVSELPVKTQSAAIKIRYFNYLYISDGRHTWLQQRTAKDVWQGLYEFPLVETTSERDGRWVMKNDWPAVAFGGMKHSARLVAAYTHLLSHQHIRARFFEVRVQPGFVLKKLPTFETLLTDLHSYPVSRLTEKFLANITNA